MVCPVDKYIDWIRDGQNLTEARKLEIEVFLRTRCGKKQECTLAYNTRMIEKAVDKKMRDDPTRQEEDKRSQG